MKVVVGDRQTGKTRAALEFMRDNPEAVMVCHTLQEAYRVRAVAQEMGFELPVRRVISADQAGEGRALYGRAHTTTLVVDNAELVLRELLRHPVALLTATAEEES